MRLTKPRMRKKLLSASLVFLLACGGVMAESLSGEKQVLPPMPSFPALPEPLAELAADLAGTVYFHTRTPYDLDVLLNRFETLPLNTAMGTLVLPKQAGTIEPVPAMVLLHGSDGIAEGREMEYATLLAEKGYAALVLDYYSPRGLHKQSPYMLKVLSVTEFDVVTDAYSALRFLNRHPAIDGKRVGVMGFSYGGIAARLLMDERIREIIAPQLQPFALHVDFYGPCHQSFGIQKTTGAPLLTLRGAQDASNDLLECTREEQKLRTAGSLVAAKVYAGAGHAWEAIRPRAIIDSAPYVHDCKIDYDESGYPYVNAKALVDVPITATRENRYLLRAASGEKMQDCVKHGYIMGRDDTVKQNSDRELLEFLAEQF